MSLFSIIFVSIAGFASNNLCVVETDGQEITLGDELPFQNSNGQTNIIQRMNKGDYYFCNVSNQQRKQRLNLSADSRRSNTGDVNIHLIGKPKRLDDFPEVYLDGDPGQDISVLNRPGKTWKDVRDDPGVKGVAYPNVASDEHRLFLKDLDYRFVPNGDEGSSFRRSAQVIVVKDSPEALAAYENGNFEHPNIKTGWVDQRQLRSTAFPAEFRPAPKEEPCEEETITSPTIKEQVNEIVTQLNSRNADVKNMIVTYLDDNKCFGIRSDPKPIPKIAKLQGITAGMAKYLRRGPLPSDSKYPGFTADQMNLMRVIAFTVWGEMRQSSCPTRYRKAVARILLNRAEKLKETGKVPGAVTCQPPPGSGSKSTYFAKEGLGTSAACVVGAKNQFHVWDGNNVNYDKLKCVETDEEEFSAALELAYDAVTDLEQFKQDTKALEGVMFYTSGSSFAGLTEIKKTKYLSDGPLDKKSCVRLWRDPKFSLKPEKYNPLTSESFAHYRPHSVLPYGND